MQVPNECNDGWGVKRVNHDSVQYLVEWTN